MASIVLNRKLSQLVFRQCHQLRGYLSPTCSTINRIRGHSGSVSLPTLSSSRCYCTSKPDKKEKITSDEDDNRKPSSTTNNIPQSVAEKYVEFQDSSRVIQDVIEEVWDPLDPFEDTRPKILYERGMTGVFDLGELTHLLREERAYDICAIKIPKEMDYADHMVIVTAKSPKHMFALATFVRRRFKHKKLKATDVLPRIEGTEKSDDWLALDLGNIILHIFTQETRELMDLETLWTVGPQYDDLSNQKDPEIVQLLKLFQ